jgi:Tol biopolymer transport system component
MSSTSRFDRIERRMPYLITELASPSMPDYVDDLLARSAATRQRPRWAFLERWFPMGALARRRLFVPVIPYRPILVAILLVALLVATAVLIGAQHRVPPPFGVARNGLVAYEQNEDIYTGDPASGNARALIAGPTKDFDAAYSRDGTKIAFLRRVQPETVTTHELIALLVASADGSNAVDVSGPLSAPDWWEWSPDGAWIAFQAKDALVPRIHVVPTDGSAPPRALDVKMPVDTLAWLPPSGQEIVFRGTSTMSGLFAVRPDGTGLRALTPTDGDLEDGYQRPTPSPDGRFVAYTRWEDPEPYEGQFGFRIHLIELATGVDREVTFGSPSHSEGFPVFSPDSSRIVFQSFAAKGWHYMVAPVDGSRPPISVGPTATFDQGMGADFSPDGKEVLVNVDGKETRLANASTGGDGDLLDWAGGGVNNWQRLAP